MPYLQYESGGAGTHASFFDVDVGTDSLFNARKLYVHR